MLWLPTVSELVVSVALPVLSRSADPIDVAPSLNITVPEGTPAPPPEAVTAAVKVTDCPKTLGLEELESAVTVLL
jgi:hypothetical protein